MKLKHTQEIDRPVDKVFRFVAVEHVRNHPRWDPDIELKKASDGPIGVGTVLRRVNRRSGTPVEGTMEVVEFSPNRSMATVIHDGAMEMRGRMDFAPLDGDRTRLTTTVELPDMDPPVDKDFLMSRLERSGDIRKQLIESET